MQLSVLRLSFIETSVAIVFAIVFCIYFFPGENSLIRVHDTFDGNFSTRHVLIRSGQFFNTSPSVIVPGIMNGLPRGVFPKFTEVTSILMYLFGSLGGFAINFVLLRLVAFSGIYLFAKDHLKFKPDQKGFVILTAIAFACLPFFTIHGITIAGIPLLFWAFFNILKPRKLFLSYLAFIGFSLWANFVLVGVHAILGFGILALYYSVRQRKILFHAFGLVLVLLVAFVVSEYMLFYMHWFNTAYQSSRGGFEKQLGLNLKGVFGNSVRLFFEGNYSAAGYFGYLFFPVFGIAILGYYRKWDKGYNIALFFILLAVMVSVLTSVLDWKSFGFFYEKFPVAKEFNLKRFFNFLPGLFFLGLISTLIAMNRNNIKWRILSSMLLFILLIFIWRGNVSYSQNGFMTSGLEVDGNQRITFKEFFDPLLYSQIKREMGADTLDNVVHLGLSPSPSKYAGLNVLDDYQGDYPKQYKEEFRKIIEKELEKSPLYKANFDGWGARCYMTSADIYEGRSSVENGMPVENNLEINTSQLKKMHTSYLLSSVIIKNADALHLKFQKVFVSQIDLKRIILYKINIS